MTLASTKHGHIVTYDFFKFSIKSLRVAKAVINYCEEFVLLDNLCCLQRWSFDPTELQNRELTIELFYTSVEEKEK